VPDEYLDIIITANRRIIELSDVREIYFRAGKSDSWLNDALSKLGYSPENIEEIKTIFPYFPNPTDLVRFAVREVYTPAIVSKYGQMEDFPPQFLEEAKKAGLPEDQAKNYWAAHWELPSALMGFEMMHRGVITEEELKTLMRTLDIMPYWRDKLIEISYNPLTRVDVRRMYGMGVLNLDQVYKSYKDIGYNDENARLMTEFTAKYETSADKELSKAEILDGYKRKYFSVSEATELLKTLGYDDTEVDYYLSKEEYNEYKEQKQDMLKLVEDMYKKGLVTDNEVISELAKLNMQNSEITYYLNKWAVSLVHKTSQPEKADLKNWLQKKVISRDIFIDEMRNLGYNDNYISCYLQEVTGKGI
jgi:hypothetical protein